MGHKQDALTRTFNFFERNRRMITGGFLLAGLPLILFTRPGWPEGGIIYRAFIYGGTALILGGIAGRAWCTMYIGGRKNSQLVQDGPYSMCRNPLYFFSFLGGLGACIVLENLAVIILYLMVFSLYYPFVIKSEEKRLEMLFGTAFAAYKEKAPAFFPNPFIFHAGNKAPAQPKYMAKTLLDGSIFLLFIPIAYMIARLQASGILHAYWKIP
ncbi:MAG: methyltransferase family protein [Nitrospirota bacterium]